jgi:hypothetical protein
MRITVKSLVCHNVTEIGDGVRKCSWLVIDSCDAATNVSAASYSDVTCADDDECKHLEVVLNLLRNFIFMVFF